MSLEFNADTDLVLRSSLGGSITSDKWTLAGWVRIASGLSSSTGYIAMSACDAGGNQCAYEYYNGTVYAIFNGNVVGSVNWSGKLDVWHYLAWVQAASNDLKAYYCAESAGSMTTIGTSTAYWMTPNRVSFGKIAGVFAEGTASPPGQYRYLRWWEAASLTAAELLTERDRTTPHATYASNCKGSWKLPDGTTTTDDSGNSNVVTITSGGTSAQEPTGPTDGSSTPIAALARHYAMLRAAG
jgi:hypothetical protein